MAVPVYREKAVQLDNVLTEGTKLYKSLLNMEEKLRKQLMKGDYNALLEDEEKRKLLQQEIACLEDKRKSLVPGERSIREYIKTRIAKTSQPALLEKLDEIKDILQKTKAVHEVNRALLEERIRFSKELQDLVLNTKIAHYDQKGRLQRSGPGAAGSLNRSC